MAITYYKRFRMELDLTAPLRPVALAAPFQWVPWDDSLMEAHARVKCRCFHEELDSMVFPCLGELEGCRRLMREIRRKPGFLPQACWLVSDPHGYCAVIQGVIDRQGIGAIQNVGVVPEYRGMGLGRAIVLQALHGFRRAGLQRAHLEVTADNQGAVQLYRALGFRKAKVLYKAVSG